MDFSTLFKRKSSTQLVMQQAEAYDLVDASIYKGYDVIHYPLTRRFYPRWRGRPIYRRHNDGVLEPSHSDSYCEWYRNEKDAWQLIDEMILQSKLETAIVIKTHPLLR